MYLCTYIHILKYTYLRMHIYPVNIDNVQGLIVCKRKQNTQNYRLFLHLSLVFHISLFFAILSQCLLFLWYMFKYNIRKHVMAENRGVKLGSDQPLSLKLEPEPHPHWKPDWKWREPPPRQGLWHQLWHSEFWSLRGSAAHMKCTHALEWKV